MPPTIDLHYLPALGRDEIVTHELGVGYARLVVQLTAYSLNLRHVWLMDDNVQDCYKLDYQKLLQQGQHDNLKRTSFGEVMTQIENQVWFCSGKQQSSAMPIINLLSRCHATSIAIINAHVLSY